VSPGVIAALRLFGDAVGAVGFVAAFFIVLAVPFRGDLKREAAIKALLLGAIGIYAFVLTTAILRELGLPSTSDLVEDNLEVLYPLVALGLVFAVYSAQQYTDVLSSQRALAQSHDLMMDIVDGAPAGIMFLSPDGRIVFANDTAKHVLDLTDDPASGALCGPGWIAGESPHPEDLSVLVDEHPYEGRSLSVRWPDGWTVDLVASGSPRSDARGALGGMVVTFERPGASSRA
jgi:PAS domain-containing protein